jgi:hypothetical protein
MHEVKTVELAKSDFGDEQFRGHAQALPGLFEALGCRNLKAERREYRHERQHITEERFNDESWSGHQSLSNTGAVAWGP